MNKINLIQDMFYNRLWNYWGILLFGCLFFSSCTKLDKVDEVITKDNKLRLSIKVKGLTVPEESLNKEASVNSFNRAESSSVLHQESYKESSDYGDIVIDFISSHSDFEIDNREVYRPLSTISNKATSTPIQMAEEVKYYFMVYSQVTGNLLDEVMGSVGTVLTVSVPEGHDLVWYAYSYNSDENIDAPNSSNPQIATPTNSPLLYATGQFSANQLLEGDNPLQITFIHQTNRLSLEVDTRSMFADISNIDVKFDDNTITSGIFDIKTGQISNIAPVDVGELDFSAIDVGSNRLKRNTSVYYTASHQPNYAAKFSNFRVTYPNNITQDIVLPNSGVASFTGFSTGVSNATRKALKLTLKPALRLPSKKFLLYGPPNRVDKGFQAVLNSLSGSFLRSTANLGTNSNYIKINQLPEDIEQVYYTTSGPIPSNLAVALSDPANYPDIVICSMLAQDRTTAEDLTALAVYLSRGGTVFLLTETVQPVTQSFLRTVLKEPALVLAQGDGGGAVYKLKDVDPQVLNGIFGDVRGAYWGQDGSMTQYVQGISNINNLVVYTDAASNYLNTPSGITMFRHKTLNLYFAGDTGFLAGAQSGVQNGSYDSHPYHAQVQSNYFPVVRTLFGVASPSNALEPGLSRGSWSVSNSIIFGNALAWMLERAHFLGVDRSPISANDRAIQIREDNWNFERD